MDTPAPIVALTSTSKAIMLSRSAAAGPIPSSISRFVFDANGERLTPTYAIKKGTRYRYYVSSSLIKGARGATPGAGAYRPAIWKDW
jgi:hypothetical protein